MKYSVVLLICLAIVSNPAFALPIDWNGNLGFDLNTIKNHRKSTDSCTAGAGSQCITDGANHARFQSYVFRLNPSLIVNDSATVKAEFSTSNYRGGFLGGNSEWGEAGNSSYYNVYSGNNGLNVDKIYVELYADTALFRVGKYTKNFGMGAIINDGDKTFDRFFSLYDGMEAEFKIGNFKLTPHFAKIYTDNTKPSGRFDVIETGITALFENPNTNLEFGVFYALREAQSQSRFYDNSGAQDVSIVDIYIAKKWENLGVALEVPMLTGKVGSAYNGEDNTNFDTYAYLAKLEYNSSPKAKWGVSAGLIQGDKGSTEQVEAMYLHPNFKIAELMNRYNYNGFNDSNQNIFEASVSNMTYVRLEFNYITDSWTWKVAFIKATANEVASKGEDFYWHEGKQLVKNAANDQSDDMGYEFDLGFDYLWNPSIVVEGFLAYHKVGDYYKFGNAADDLDVADVTSYGLRLNLSF